MTAVASDVSKPKGGCTNLLPSGFLAQYSSATLSRGDQDNRYVVAKTLDAVEKLSLAIGCLLMAVIQERAYTYTIGKPTKGTTRSLVGCGYRLLGRHKR
jgi:hypothetical protein